MTSPSRQEVEHLHDRMMSHDPTATHDVFDTFMDPLIRSLRRYLGCSPDDANASAADAVFAYLRQPERFDARQSTLWNYLSQIARRRAHDSHRTRTAREKREKNPLTILEVHPPAPNNGLEGFVIAKQLLERLEERIKEAGLPQRDIAGIRVIVLHQGRVPAEEMADALGLSHLPPGERLHEVRRHTERLKRLLRSLYMEDSDVDS
ncbi:sigma-70 family RNA polymerase sigma factor [Corallococcus sp. AB011P]|uniref:RNA polymerase sigma factor n=1 Tax=unclassified Corallococcus TaxID=2685029 RepID=UPI000EA2C06A|nr:MULTISPECIES: sigma factor [unclassified Corallococcus]RKG57522.1 sigma-70 family RNA polymerase sigma factor [Corallococcus sp. AB011P]RKH80583.1 sigma-70 family RNA polymerase sigma factor [Corallococcus sp. AB045]